MPLRNNGNLKLADNVYIVVEHNGIQNSAIVETFLLSTPPRNVQKKYSGKYIYKGEKEETHKDVKKKNWWHF